LNFEKVFEYDSEYGDPFRRVSLQESKTLTAAVWRFKFRVSEIGFPGLLEDLTEF
jgi:hypothetical protein